MKSLLTIAGSDTSGGAGVQADLRAFDRLDARGLSVITAITSQTSEEFLSIHPVSADIVTQQLSAVSEETTIDGIKIGMVATAANVQAIIWFLKRQKDIPIIVDPILDASTGYPLIEPAALPIFEQKLLPLSTVVTPNLDEASTLAKMQVKDIDTMHTAAKTIYEKIQQMREGIEKPLSVIVKGGHLSHGSTDIIYSGEGFVEITGKELSGSIHGSGCLYSSVLLASLVNGDDIIQAAKSAKQAVEKEIEQHAF